ncbi:hypothetical protein L0Y59_00310 [Candidatus Uhrbacteria bacterium]|nr:hypothetical protein [Candidatus Uhrbacteria bacterium]
MPGSWRERLRKVLRREPTVSGSSAPEELAADREDLLADLERTFALYRSKVADFAARIDGLPVEEARREAEILRDAHDAIRRTMRRIEASARTANELMEELREWEAREGEGGPRHADHPDIRAEVIRSELRTRGVMPVLEAMPVEASPFVGSGYAPQEPVAPFMRPSEIESEAEEDPFGRDADMDDLHVRDVETILRSIRETTREAERWHGLPEQEAEVVDDLRRLRDMHTLLKRIDRSRGTVRDRLTLAIRMR